ncbi:5-methylthioribose kinase [Silvimonas terrae]|uniref:S-methyl-5-thioribose kinase n=1 Tax=Silvimonas terrae TaxID=300266 RepID=A0A840RFK2_9NEIS|nr:S-methyl-5-thioribose kinase [Silvimonas terrae]MBB5191180.1 5-methylthioribose kinase [Silvimonas terrae]
MSLPVPEGYQTLDDARLRAWLAGLPHLAAKLGGDSAAWQIEEVGDGNLNLVFLVRGPAGGVCVKQSLPYVRAAGESWPMPLERAFFEHQHYAIAGPHLAGLIPQSWHYDPRLFASVIELLSPHRILRQELVAGHAYPQAALAVAEFVARSAVLTSPLAQPFETVFAHSAVFSRNVALTRVTAELIFADPFEDLVRNRWTTPELDHAAAAIRNHAAVRAAVARLGHAFLTRKEALLHGDLHTGSVMVSADDTRVIDPEFAVYGPVGFDAGLFMANLLMAWFAQPGHATAQDNRQAFADGILQQVRLFWQHFAQRYDALWQAHASGDAWPARLFDSPATAAAFATERAERIRAVFADALGFAGAEIIRRILGFAHNLDFESIADRPTRAAAEAAALQLAEHLLLHSADIADIDTLLAQLRQDTPNHTRLEAVA